jgi:hypothetical protein
MTELAGLPVAMLIERGGWGVVLLFVLMGAVGWIIPLRTHTRELNREIKRGDDLKEALDNAQRAHEIESQQMAEILSFVRTASRNGGA